MSMGIEVRLWPCVLQRPQMPPPRNPQVQILGRGHALKEERRRKVVVERGRSWTEISFFSFSFSCSSVFFACIPSM